MTDWSDRIARTLETAVALYNRHETTVAAPIPDEPVLFVANHGFGGVFDLNVVAFGIAHRASGDDRPVIALTHQIAWQLGVGKLLEPFGARPAGRATADEALADGTHVLVFPGGDIDAFKSWKDRNTVLFAGRAGFAQLAREAGVPIVPVVTSGGGESVIVLDDGAALAEATGARERFRLHRLPITVSIPWGSTSAPSACSRTCRCPPSCAPPSCPPCAPAPQKPTRTTPNGSAPRCRPNSTARPTVGARSSGETGDSHAAHRNPQLAPTAPPGPRSQGLDRRRGCRRARRYGRMRHETIER
ncbi:1-acyl-sn-glycerol-3-phosphate acyltransferase [Tsukamurella sp. PLM1]|uniref:1-acyl-sn-glycerol-3-phosphate acyltransferase n=1 Tax=Tsukamurella sp. PLM1 TaxID=2929795 RepID=UPI00204DFBBD|nr:1-acyl-sn-glycerol-3-phosphate acyltransferase [Tsukamurella sp. PLM1]BDH56668.1 hypothetical protein MTP03_16070 [Tsukamurella sp. PLM1]